MCLFLARDTRQANGKGNSGSRDQEGRVVGMREEESTYDRIESSESISRQESKLSRVACERGGKGRVERGAERDSSF